jgi:hypothetical protein
MIKILKTVLMLFLLVVVMWRCTSEQEPIPDDCIANGITLVLSTKTDANCGQADGSISVTATGAGGVFTFTINGQASASTGDFENLAAGSYVIVATEAGGCTAELTVEILNADGVNATADTTDSDCESPDGSITVNATGGTAPYEYKIGDNAFVTTNTFSSLMADEYAVTVRDASGCEVTLQVQVKSDVTFGEINTIIQTNCAVSGCHAGNQAPDFRNTANITGNANRIEIRTGARTMPPPSSGRTLTDTEIAKIACWVADGASGN